MASLNARNTSPSIADRLAIVARFRASDQDAIVGVDADRLVGAVARPFVHDPVALGFECLANLRADLGFERDRAPVLRHGPGRSRRAGMV